MAKYIRTVLGDIDSCDLGQSYCHEHLLIMSGSATKIDPDFLLDDLDQATTEIAAFCKAGGQALVDMMPPGIGRNPEGLVTLAQRTGCHIIATTGFHKERYYDAQHWLYTYSVETIAQLFADEVTMGMDQWGYRGPHTRRIEARAGIIKVATDYYKWTAWTDKWFEAAAMAQLSTGVPIATHTEHGVLAIEQVKKLTDLGVPGDKIIVGHIDKNPDPYVMRDLVAMGAFLEFDGPSRQKYGPDTITVALIQDAVTYGYSQRILLGMDLARRSYWPTYGGGPGLTYLLRQFMPRLQAEGLGNIVPLLLVENPAHALAFMSS